MDVDSPSQSRYTLIEIPSPEVLESELSSLIQAIDTETSVVPYNGIFEVPASNLKDAFLSGSKPAFGSGFSAVLIYLVRYISDQTFGESPARFDVNMVDEEKDYWDSLAVLPSESSKDTPALNLLTGVLSRSSIYYAQDRWMFGVLL